MAVVNIRQGDVLLYGRKPISGDTLKAKHGYKDKGDNIIIEGELTGHFHKVTSNGKLYEKDGKIILEAKAGCILEHPEHKHIQVPEGTYEIEIQEEYDEVKHSAKVKD